VNVHRVLSEMFAEALRWGVIATNPAAGICPLGVPRPKLHVPHQQTCGEILRRVHGRQVGESVVLAIGTGMRLGEILGRSGGGGPRAQGAPSCFDASYAAGEFTFTAPTTSRARRSVDLPKFMAAFLRIARNRASGRWHPATSGASTTHIGKRGTEQGGSYGRSAIGPRRCWTRPAA
jgi:hypothetical protein